MENTVCDHAKHKKLFKWVIVQEYIKNWKGRICSCAGGLFTMFLTSCHSLIFIFHCYHDYRRVLVLQRMQIIDL